MVSPRRNKPTPVPVVTPEVTQKSFKEKFCDPIPEIIKDILKGLKWLIILIIIFSIVIHSTFWLESIGYLDETPLHKAIDSSLKRYSENYISNLDPQDKRYRRIVFLCWFQDYLQLETEMEKKNPKWVKEGFDQKLNDLYKIQIQKYNNDQSLSSQLEEINSHQSQGQAQGNVQ